MKRFGKKVIKMYDKYIDNESVSVIVTLDDAEEYYNVYLVNDKYKTDELNSLTLQEPVSSIKDPKTYFNDGYMVARVIEYIIWDRFHEHGIAETFLDINFTPHEE